MTACAPGEPTGMRRPKMRYLRFDPFEGCMDLDIRAERSRVVRTRKEHECMGNRLGERHVIPVGSWALYQSAILDGRWHSFHYCCACIDRWLDELDEPVDPAEVLSTWGSDGA